MLRYKLKAGNFSSFDSSPGFNAYWVLFRCQAYHSVGDDDGGKRYMARMENVYHHVTDLIFTERQGLLCLAKCNHRLKFRFSVPAIPLNRYTAPVGPGSCFRRQLSHEDILTGNVTVHRHEGRKCTDRITIRSDGGGNVVKTSANLDFAGRG